jgi:hypothetical protein
MKTSSRAVHRGLVLALTLGSGSLACFVSSATMSGCGGDDAFTNGDSSVDASTSDAAFLDARAPSLDGSSDASSDGSTGTADGGADAAVPTHVLVSSGNDMLNTSNLASFNLTTGALEGTSPYAGGFGVTYNSGSAPFLLEQEASVVARLDTTSPWKIDASWNVLGTDLPDSGSANANPYAVVVSAGTKAYVLRYNRNVIDIIDPSQTVDGGAPTGTIDISAQVQASDPDGVVEMDNGFYDPSTKRLWVVLQNTNEVPPFACTAAKATVIAIDTTTDTLVTNLGGTGPNGAYAFTLADPDSVVFDSANNRIIAAMFGCSAADGGAEVDGSGVEAISLADGTSSVLFAASALGGGRGAAIALVGGTQAVVGVDDPATYATTGYLVDLTAKSVKSTLAVLPQAFISDGAGHLYGSSYAADGGTNQDVIEVDVSDGSTRVVASSAVTDPDGYVNSVTLW